MPNKNKITIGTKVDREFADYLKEKALKENKSLGDLVREGLKGERQTYEEESVASKIIELAFMYDVDAEKLLSNLGYLLESGKLFVSGGKILWNPLRKNPEYVSVDEAIDNMNVPEWRKKSLKESILKNLNVSFDDTGNGGGL